MLGAEVIESGSNHKLVVSVEVYNRRQIFHQISAEQWEVVTGDGSEEFDPQSLDALTTIGFIDPFVPSGRRVRGDVAFNVGNELAEEYFVIHTPNLLEESPPFIPIDDARGVWRVTP